MKNKLNYNKSKVFTSIGNIVLSCLNGKILSQVHYNLKNTKLVQQSC